MSSAMLIEESRPQHESNSEDSGRALEILDKIGKQKYIADEAVELSVLASNEDQAILALVKAKRVAKKARSLQHEMYKSVSVTFSTWQAVDILVKYIGRRENTVENCLDEWEGAGERGEVIMERPVKEFTVTAESTLVAYIRKDRRGIANEIVVYFLPNNRPSNEEQHEVAEWFILLKARRVALELASELSGMDIEDLRVAENEGVVAIKIIPREGLTYPVVDTSSDDLTAAEHMIRTSVRPQHGDNPV